MKTYQTSEIKNLALLGNSGAGKTTLAEAMVFESGALTRKGDISSKNTVSDYKPIEKGNENSVFSSVVFAEHKNKKINFIDNPGMTDFIGSVINSLHPADAVAMIINAQNGVEVGTEIHKRQMEQFNKPMIIGINHLDHEKTNYERTIEMVTETFGGNAVSVQFPVNPGIDFDSIIDVLEMKMYTYKDGKASVSDIPAEHADKAEELRLELVEKAAEADDNLMEIFFETESLSDEQLMQGMTQGILSGSLNPIFCFSAKPQIGINRFMDFIADVMPSPDQVTPIKDKAGNDVKYDASAPFSAFVFKTSNEEHIGEINYFKVITGEINEGMDVTNVRKSSKERITQLYACAGKERTKVTKLVAGDIGATVKMKVTKANDTLIAPGNDIEFPEIKYPEPKFRTAIRPLSEGDEEKLGDALNKMHMEDPTIKLVHSKELKQMIVSGQGEYHMNILKWHLDNIFKVETEYFAPKIPYRETITKKAQSDYRHKKQSGGSGQFGEVHMIIEPIVEGMVDPEIVKIDGKEYKLNIKNRDEIELEWGGKLEFFSCIVGGSIDARFMPAILKGIMEKIEEGPLTGSYARDIRVYIYDGKMHPVDSNEISFKLAGRNAFSTAFKNAGPKIMEPIYNVEVLVPSDRMGDVMSDLQGRRAIVQGMSSESGFEKITAKAPLAEMGTYSTALQSITGGRAMYSIEFAEYSQVPGDIQTELLKTYAEAQEEE
ncbi:MAG: elongation factor G [Bacteroidota bacterium]|nr:elongation factor G [Bacteroidota bacterium]